MGILEGNHWISESRFWSEIRTRFDDPDLRDRLVTNGLTTDGTHVMFNYHRRRVQMDTRIRVFISRLPIGTTEQEIESVFSKYGEIISTHQVTKFRYDKRIDTGARAIIFKRINVNVPSYIFVRGWHAFVNYIGQLRTCRICGCTGHLAKDCPRLKIKSEPANNQPVSSEPEDTESEPIRTPEPTRTFEIEEPTSTRLYRKHLKSSLDKN